MHSHLPLRTIEACRVCGGTELALILSLGSLYVSDFVTDRTIPSPEERYPLELVLCDPEKGGCCLLQLKHTVDPSKMYNFYYYHSGTNALMRQALADIARQASKRAALKKGDLVLDIGCNDGTLLRSYAQKGLKLVGFDPAKNLIPEAKVGTSLIINDYFNADAFEKKLGGKKAKIITSIAMFYDLDDPNRFVADAARCLHPEGVWIIQMSYLPLMLEMNAFDNVCHEHLEYYSMTSLENLLKRHGLKMVDVELNDVNGGSFRVTIRHEDAQERPAGARRVAELKRREKKQRLDEKETYIRFGERVLAIREKLYHFIHSEVKKGKTIYAYGASTKGNTLLQYFNLDSSLIAGAAERNPDKYGKKTVGTMIPILSEDEARSRRPDYFLVLPWHFLKGFLKQERRFFKAGGRFIVPLPEVRILPPGPPRRRRAAKN